ncbi:hypothetical protein PybrP1_008345, partial [[Pythium] brassicae (nom. inval.)]
METDALLASPAVKTTPKKRGRRVRLALSGRAARSSQALLDDYDGRADADHEFDEAGNDSYVGVDDIYGSDDADAADRARPPRVPPLTGSASGSSAALALDLEAPPSAASLLYEPIPSSDPDTKPHTNGKAAPPPPFDLQRDSPYYQLYGGSIQRTHSFPTDLYSDARFSRFEIEEAMRARDGTSLLDWLHGRVGGGAPPAAPAAAPDALDARSDASVDHEKKVKAQHLESYDYDPFESRVNMQHEHEQTEEAIRSLNIARWVMTFSIGLVTGLVACFVEVMTKTFSTFRTSTMASYVQREKTGELPFGAGFLVYGGISLAFVAVASYCVAILCPVAGGSGISEIKATLNGIKIHRVVRLKTLFCKAFGILFSVAGGLPVGKEGPMIHSGAVIGAGLSQGKSSSFGVDTSWTKFKGFRNDKEKRDFISCGAAAGVAAAFGAPIGGVLFALEEGASFWHQNLTWRTFFCAMVSAFVLNCFISVMDTGAENELDSRVFLGTLGTQTGTFTFGPFIDDKSYDGLDLVLFIAMGAVGGLFGAIFNQANKELTKVRNRWVRHRWLKFGEALLLALVTASVSFWLSYAFGECRPLAGPYSDSLSVFYCPDGQYNDLASLFAVSYQTSIKQLLHFTGDASFSPLSLALFFAVFYVLACWTYGLAVPSGLFVPSLLAGAAYGRLCVLLLHRFGFPVGAQDGMFALIGAACMLGGMARMTISLTVIILECTGVVEWGLPIMVSLMAARWVGNSFNEGLYDIHIHLKRLPFLEYDPPFYSRFLRAENVMSAPAVTVGQIAKAGEVFDILKETTHGGFPVVIPRRESDEEDAAATGAARKKQRFAGVINRRHLCVLLQRKDFFIEKPTPFTRKPAGDTTLLYNDQYALSYRDIESNYPRYPTIHEIKLDDDERDLWMDLTPYMNPTPHTTPVPRAFRLFRSLGLRHLIVLNRRNEVRGIITRKDLTPSHLKACLESLSETEKQRIQGYFNRGRSGSESFRDMASRPPRSPVHVVSPRRPALRRADSPVERASGGRDTNTAAAVAASSAMLFTPSVSSPGSSREGSNPLVNAIQSRVADLVRRYDESVADGNDDANDDDSGGHVAMPVRWRVGDVLLATHSALAKTGTRTEQAIAAEFPEDPEVAAALGDGAASFARVAHEAAQHTRQVQQMLARTIALVQQLQQSDAAQRLGESRAAGEHGLRARELAAALEALQREKAAVLGQLQEHARAHKELLAALDAQNQELKRAQIAVAMTGDEARARADEGERRLAEAQRALDTSQQSAGAWRDKFQGATKSLAAAEQRLAELETKTQAQAEEIVKHEVVLLAKVQEEKARERLKDSELQRLRAEAAAAAQALADSNERKARRGESSEQQRAALAKEAQALADKLQQAERTVLALRAELSGELRAKRQFESDNNALAKLVLELKERARVAAVSVAPHESEPASRHAGGGALLLKKATAFAISLRALAHTRRRRPRSGGAAGATPRAADDDLSTSSDDSDAEIAQEEKVLNATVQQVVTAAFPQRLPALEQSDERITRDIARYEDPKLSPMTSGDAPRALPLQEVLETTMVVPSAPMNEVERMKLACDAELARMKAQYVAGLVEYKRLVIEQYERRQSQLHEHHRAEIESLIMLVQEKFKREIEKHGEKVLRAKESLKLLYRAMAVDSDSGGDSRASFAVGGGRQPESSEEPVPLKSLLRAAVFALSSSTKRARVATAEIQQIYERVKRRRTRRAAAPLSAPVGAVPAVPAAKTSMPAVAEEAARPTSPAVAVAHAGCQASDADFARLRFAKGFRGSAIAPQPMDGYVLGSSGLLAETNQPTLPASGSPHHPRRKPRRRRERGSSADEEAEDGDDLDGSGGAVLHLVEGAAFSAEIVGELRCVLPALPAGAYYLSAALKQKLLLALLRFYAAWDARRGRLPSLDSRPGDDSGDVLEVVIGSPRDTPFMRRKALES